MGIRTINSREARINWRDLLDDILAGNADVVIERNGKAIAAMIPVEDYQDLQDELEDLRAGRRAAELYAEYKRNPAVARSIKDVEADLIARGLLDGRQQADMGDTTA